MKKIMRMSLFWAGVVVLAFFVSSACFILVAGFVWATNKISVFLDKLCIIWNLDIPNALLGMLPYSIVGSFILVPIAVLIYFSFFRKTLFSIDE
jgi:ABC-type phosphate transport system permease subunit